MRAMRFLRLSPPLFGAGVVAARAAQAGEAAAEAREAEAAVEAEPEMQMLHRRQHLLCAPDHLALLHPPFR